MWHSVGDPSGRSSGSCAARRGWARSAMSITITSVSGNVVAASTGPRPSSTLAAVARVAFGSNAYRVPYTRVPAWLSVRLSGVVRPVDGRGVDGVGAIAAGVVDLERGPETGFSASTVARPPVRAHHQHLPRSRVDGRDRLPAVDATLGPQEADQTSARQDHERPTPRRHRSRRRSRRAAGQRSKRLGGAGRGDVGAAPDGGQVEAVRTAEDAAVPDDPQAAAHRWVFVGRALRRQRLRCVRARQRQAWDRELRGLCPAESARARRHFGDRRGGCGQRHADRAGLRRAGIRRRRGWPSSRPRSPRRRSRHASTTADLRIETLLSGAARPRGRSRRGGPSSGATRRGPSATAPPPCAGRRRPRTPRSPRR